jgi:hypothetical protein
MALALALLLACALPNGAAASLPESEPGTFLPSLDGPKESAAEWMRRFEASGGRSRDALWSLYWRDDRSDEVIAFLRRWFERSRADIQAEIETILIQWGHACPAPRHEPGRDGHVFVHTGAWYAPPRLATTRNDARPRKGSQPPDLGERVNSALELVQDRESAGTGVTRLIALDDGAPNPRVPPPSTLAARRALESSAEGVRRAVHWAVDFAGTAAVEAIAAHVAEITRGLDPLEVARWRETSLAWLPLAPLEGPRRRAYLAQLRPEVPVDGGDDRKTFFQLITEIRRGAIHWSAEYDAHSDAAPLQVGDAELADLIVQAAKRWIARPEFSQSTAVEPLEAVGSLVSRFPELAPRLAPTLAVLSASDGEVGLAALRAQCHGGVIDDETFEDYVRVLDQMPADGREAFGLVPCLPRHTPETLMALDRFADRASNLRGLAQRLAAGGIFDRELSKAARRLHAALEDGSMDDWPSWHLLMRVDSGWRFAILPEDSTIRILWKTLVTARSKHAAGESVREEEERMLAILDVPYGMYGAGGPNDPFETAAGKAEACGLATPRFHRWALRTFLHAESSLHVAATMRVLERAELDPRERALLARLSDGWFREGEFLDASRWPFQEFMRFLARESPAAIEWAGRIRHAAHRSQRLEVLDRLLDFATPTPRDLAWVEAAIRRGPAREREQALGMVDRHSLASESVIAAVRDARTDIDRFVAEAARGLSTARGW